MSISKWIIIIIYLKGIKHIAHILIYQTMIFNIPEVIVIICYVTKK